LLVKRKNSKYIGTSESTCPLSTILRPVRFNLLPGRQRFENVSCACPRYGVCLSINILELTIAIQKTGASLPKALNPYRITP
jgi:hypothetical protein